MWTKNEVFLNTPTLVLFSFVIPTKTVFLCIIFINEPKNSYHYFSVKIKKSFGKASDNNKMVDFDINP